MRVAARSILLLLSLVSITLSAPSSTAMDEKEEEADDVILYTHFSHEEMQHLMTWLSEKQCPEITRLYSIGQSVEKRELWVLEMTDNPGVHEPGEPEFKYVGNIHGNEVTGKDTMLYLMQYLCQNYGVDEEVTSLLSSTRLHFLPSMNPDGYVRAFEGDVEGVKGRRNANNIDLNRNFPDRFASAAETKAIQPETAAIIQWLKDYPFVLSAALHNGALVANYPYDNSVSGLSINSPTTDDDIFRQLALSYSAAHPTMHLGKPCPDYISEKFKNGITNGAAWYTLNGGMQDYNYLHSNCMEVTIEQNCQKFPEAYKMKHIWEENRKPLMEFIKAVHRGVKGFVFDGSGNPIHGAIVIVQGRDHPVTCAEDGDFWRLLSPGDYTLEVSAENYEPSFANITVTDQSVLQVNFTLIETGIGAETDSTSSTLQSTTPTLSTSIDDITKEEGEEGASSEGPSSQDTTADTSLPPLNRTSSSHSSSLSVSIAGTSGGDAAEVASSQSKEKGSRFPLAIGVTMVAFIFGLLCAIVIISIVIGYNIVKSKHVRKGFAPVPMNEDLEEDRQKESEGFDYGAINPPVKGAIIDTPAYSDDPPAFLPVDSITKNYESSSEEEDVLYPVSNGTES